MTDERAATAVVAVKVVAVVTVSAMVTVKALVTVVAGHGGDGCNVVGVVECVVGDVGE